MYNCLFYYLHFEVKITCFFLCLSVGVNLQLLLNVGGPTRLSRADMAEIVAEVKGIDKSLIKRVSAASVSVNILTTIFFRVCRSQIFKLI